MARRSTYIKFFRHFAFRLAGRYNILITFEQYQELCKVHLTDTKVLDKEDRDPVIQGTMTIEGVDVIVRKDMSRHRMLLTALPMKRKQLQQNELTAA